MVIVKVVRSKVGHNGVCEKSTPPEKNTLGTPNLKNTKSGGGEEFMLLSCRAEAHAKRVLCSQTPGIKVVGFHRQWGWGSKG